MTSTRRDHWREHRRDPRPDSSVGGVRKFLRLVTIEHSVFALPFAYIAALTAMWHASRSVHWWQLLLITVAMVSARTFAMARQPDHRPRHRRPKPAYRTARTGHRRGVDPHGVDRRRRRAGRVPGRRGGAQPAVPGAGARSRGAAGRLPVRQAVHRLPAGAARRWRSSIGTGRGLARRHRACCSSGPALVLGLAVGTVDRRLRPHLRLPGRRGRPARSASRSFPARFGVPFALRASSLVHVVTFALFVWFGAAAGLGWLWWIGLALTAVAFVYEHRIVRADDLSRVNRAFFTANGFVGIALFVFALADLMVHGLRRMRTGATMTPRSRGSSACPGRRARRTRARCWADCSTPACRSTWSCRAPPG